MKVDREADDVVVRVRDAGVGFQDDAPRRLGEPFYTTKPPGEGMGLGLFLIRTLIQDAGGQLEASRAEPHGAEVALRLKDLGHGGPDRRDRGSPDRSSPDRGPRDVGLPALGDLGLQDPGATTA